MPLKRRKKSKRLPRVTDDLYYCIPTFIYTHFCPLHANLLFLLFYQSKTEVYEFRFVYRLKSDSFLSITCRMKHLMKKDSIKIINSFSVLAFEIIDDNAHVPHDEEEVK